MTDAHDVVPAHNALLNPATVKDSLHSSFLIMIMRSIAPTFSGETNVHCVYIYMCVCAHNDRLPDNSVGMLRAPFNHLSGGIIIVPTVCLR